MNLPSLVISNQIISIQLLREQPFDFYDPGWGDFLKKIVRARLCKKNRTDHKKKKIEDLKVLRRSPDLLNNCKTGQGQLQLKMKLILFYHIWRLQPLWSNNLNNLTA